MQHFQWVSLLRNLYRKTGMTWAEGAHTVRDLIDRAADANADRIFLVSPESGRSLTFKQLQQAALRLCRRFHDIGLEHGDKIALLMDNGLFTVQLFLGTMYGGFVSVPLNVRAGRSHLSYMTEHCDAKIIFVGDNYKSLIKEATHGISRPPEIIAADNDVSLGDSQRPYSRSRLTPVSADDAALLMYSSGTTGQPNGAIHTHKSLLAHGRNAAQSHQLTSADRSLLVLPIYHINAECVTLLPTLTSGGSVVVPHGFVVNEFWDWLADYGCTWSALVPTIVSQLLDLKDRKAERRASAFQRIRFLRTSSGPLSPSLHREFLEKFKPLLIQAMGCSEGGNVFSNPLPPGKNKIGSPGFPWGFEARIVDREGVDVPEGEPGEVLLQGDGLMQGYYKDPAGTAAAFDGKGWFHTGDLAYRDQDGYFFVVGRSKELVIKGGMNIAPKQVDEVLESHPAVLEAAALGVPDRYLGEDLVAFAVLRDGMTCSEGELLSFCDERLGHFKTPTRIHFASELPKGPSGKVQRLRLVQEAQRLTTENSILQTNIHAPTDALVRETPIPLRAPDASLEGAIGQIWSDLLAEPGIDPSSNFFALGGQSLLAIQYISRLREKLQVIISLSDFFENPTVKQQAELVRKRLAKSSGAVAEAQSSTESEIIRPRDRNLPCRLSPSQDRLWFLEQLISGEPVYNESEAVRLKGNLNIDVLERAVNYVIERREVLRSTIEVRNGEPQVVVHDNWLVKISRIDLTELPVGEREAELGRLLVDEPRRRHRLEAEPGFRFTVITLAREEHACIVMMHHIICDSASLGILWRETASAYQCFLKGRSPSLPALPIQYWDYAVWQRLPSRQAAVEADLSFWREKLREAPEVLDLPMDRLRPPVSSYHGEKRLFSFDTELTTKLRSFSRREQSSLFTLFAAALNALFCRYTGKDDILLGIPIADRDRPESQSLIGFMIDTQVLRTDLSGEPTFRELMARVQRGVAELYSHRSAPFDQVVDAVRPQRSLSYSPLIQVLLNWRDRDDQPQFIGFPGLAVEPLLSHSRTSKFDLTFTVTDADDRILLELEYSTELFDQPRIERMVGHLRTLLEGAATKPEQRLADLPLLTAAERDQLVDWNQTEVAYPRDRCLHELIEEQVAREPDAVAVAFADKQLTYRELDKRANQLAHYLQKIGVVPDMPVGICLERSLEMVVGLLGILKAGGAYVPLDPEYPKERLAFMLEDAGVRVVLTQAHVTASLPTHQARAIRLDADWPSIAKESPGQVVSSVRPENLAYMIYTSGSTGRPKGAMNTHVAIVNRLLWMQDAYRLTPLDRVLQKTPFSFDVSVWEFFWPLLTGAKLVLALSGGQKDSAYLANVIRNEEITTIHFVPSMLSVFLEETGLDLSCASLKRVICSGEALPFELQQRFFSLLRADLHNLYGPTEAAVDVTFWACERESRLCTVPIGRPIANTHIHILDQNLQPVPIGVPGELHIGGIAVGRGYHNRPELTAEKFIADPFRTDAGAQLYKTGDLAFYMPNGAIEYVGRLDHQVKMRGFRVELGEIETVLAAFPGVREAAVLARQDVPGDMRLVAYLTVSAGATLNDSDLRTALQGKLPDYMIPSAFVLVERFPLMPNGKLDRKALPAADLTTASSRRAPRSPRELALCKLFAEALRTDRVSIDDNFFARGGNSLLAVRVIRDINEKLKVHLSVPVFFQNPTVKGLATVLEHEQIARPTPQIIRLKQGNTGLPLYFIGSEAAEYRIADSIGDRTVFMVEVPILEGRSHATTVDIASSPPTLEEVGSLYADAVRRHVGSSPFVLIGYSLFAKVAFEAAHALRYAGSKLQCVILIDASAVGPRRSRGIAHESLRRIWRDLRIGTASGTHFMKRLVAALNDFLRVVWWMLARRLPLALLWWVLQWKWLPDALKIALKRKHFPSSMLSQDSSETLISLRQLIPRASSVGRRPLDASGVLIRTRIPKQDILPGFDLSKGWRPLFMRGFEIIEMEGDHLSLVQNPQHAAALARQIDAAISLYETRSSEMETGNSRGGRVNEHAGLMSS